MKGMITLAAIYWRSYIYYNYLYYLLYYIYIFIYMHRSTVFNVTHLLSFLFVRSTLQRNISGMGDEVTIKANPAYEAVEYDGETFINK